MFSITLLLPYAIMVLAFFCAIQGLMRKRSSGFYSLMTVFKTDSAGEICFSKAC